MISLQTAWFVKHFRKGFPEFNIQDRQLDRLGGAKCPTCNVRQQRKIIKGISSSLHSTPALSIKWAAFSGNETAVRLRQKAPIMCRDFFERARRKNKVIDWSRRNSRKMYRKIKKPVKRWNSPRKYTWSTIYKVFVPLNSTISMLFNKQLSRVVKRHTANQPP